MILKPDSLTGVLWHTLDSYKRNFALLSLLSLPFLVVFPLALFLPNFVSLGGVFLRFGSISRDVAPLGILLISIAFCVSLLLFSFSLVAINMIIKTERTLKTISFYEFERVERYTLKLFAVFFLVFLLSLAANILLYEYGLHSTFGALFSFFASLLVVFAPQAIVIDNQQAKHVPAISLSLALKKLPLFLVYTAAAVVLLLVIGYLSVSLISLFGSSETAKLVGVVINALIVLPFLEVLKTQVYLSKYSLL